MIPDSFIQELLTRVDIVDVVSRYVNLRKGGANLIGLCPFHNEKTPSFTVSPSKQFYHCFGCGAHGSALRFLTEHTGASFPEAVKTLANSVGMTVPEQQRSPAQIRLERETKAQSQLEEQFLITARDFYKANLKKAPKAIDYLKKRGITGKIAARFGLGWSGSDRRGLSKVINQYDSSALLESGLVIDTDEGSRYDRFRSRIMFPINNSKGHLIGFGGRLIEAGEPKYLNSPETRLFSKGNELYGLYEARSAIHKLGYVLVVEGYMDVVSLAQFGLENVVATLGTATTAEHIQKLKRTTDRIVFSFDGDQAGKKAAWRALQSCLPWVAEDLSIRFLFLPDAYDPDSYIREFGIEATKLYIDEAIALSTFIMQELGSRHDLTEVEGRSACVHEARPLFALMPAGGYKLQLEREFAKLVQLTPEELAELFDANDNSAVNNDMANPFANLNHAPNIEPEKVLPIVTYKEAANTHSNLGSKYSLNNPKANSQVRSKGRKNQFKSRQATPMAKRLLGLLLSYPELVNSLGDQQLELLAKNPHLQLVKEMVTLISYCGATHTGAILETVDPETDLANALQDLSTELLVPELPDPLMELNDALRSIEIKTIQDQCDSLIANGLLTVEQQNHYKVLLKRLSLLKSK